MAQSTLTNLAATEARHQPIKPPYYMAQSTLTNLTAAEARPLTKEIKQ
jgi:hypothetical protein